MDERCIYEWIRMESIGFGYFNKCTKTYIIHFFTGLNNQRLTIFFLVGTKHVKMFSCFFNTHDVMAYFHVFIQLHTKCLHQSRFQLLFARNLMYSVPSKFIHYVLLNFLCERL